MSYYDNLTVFYNQQITELQQILASLNRKSTSIGWLRFLIAVVTILAIYLTWPFALWIIVVVSITAISLFLFIVSVDTDTRGKIDNTKTLLAINEKELNHINYQYQQDYDGKDLEPQHHEYAEDLDLFGKSSLYQYINRCYSEKGKALLAERLLRSSSQGDILLQQEAVKEIASKTEWRQQLQAFGYRQEISTDTEKRVITWLNKNEDYFISSYWKTLLYVYPCVTLCSLLLYMSNVIPLSLFLLFVVLFYSVSLFISKRITPVYMLLSKIVAEINSLYNQLHWFEKEKYQSKYLLQISERIQQNLSANASQEIRMLENILNRFDVRLNVLAFFFLNTFLLWDLWQLLALQNWKSRNKTTVPFWFAAIAEIEVINTIATLAFNHPSWCYPEISDRHFTLSGHQIGHPLISSNQRVNNTFNLEGTGKIALITGSNMAGKSTFLRSLGVNIILSHAGAPVCAEKFTVSVSKLMTSMRISDNLAENTSTFYAELKKLKNIIEAVNEKEKVFILLDEILRGTNSLDRHTGSIALIKQLIREQAVAVIATHDIELAQLAQAFPASVSNYHFDVQVSNNELYFDYKLKNGICTSMNASILMKKIGIQL
jgi:hypothetical protein